MRAVVTAGPDGTREVHDVSTSGPGSGQVRIRVPAGGRPAVAPADRVVDDHASLPAGRGGRR
ncbi:hypothetical protein [Micromonospora coxensis]|uniref:Uncharacterized protein n=1 Tax=Micromonospora coxensis TaxID=356852 RepID=A0A1C5K0M1_9ACTN|nr:hypothetical protein [Micromonospora coxensis]SCG76360.1 hypothetical protein GA0070614_5904 [Micromonospora coxensis]